MAQSDVAAPFAVSSTSAVVEPGDSPRTGRDFVELPRVVVPSVVSSDEPVKNTESLQKPATTKIASAEPPASSLKESAKAAEDASPSRDSSIATPRGVEQEKISSILKEGDGFMRAGDYDQALARFRAALALEPTSRALRAKVEAVRRAQATEARVLQ